MPTRIPTWISIWVATRTATPTSTPFAGADLGPWPDPARSAWAQPLTRLPVGSTPDRPAELRAWYEDRQGQRAAQAHIKSGNPFLVVVPDTDFTYTLSVHPD